jgi:hypothetical protein
MQILFNIQRLEVIIQYKSISCVEFLPLVWYPRNKNSSRYINIATNRYTKHAKAAAQPDPKKKTKT